MVIEASNENHRVCNADGAGKAYQQKLLNLFLLGLISSSPATCIYSEFEVQQWKNEYRQNWRMSIQQKPFQRRGTFYKLLTVTIRHMESGIFSLNSSSF